MFSALLITASYAATPFSVVAGSVRIETMSPTLLRLEQEGPMGFEDRPTFTVLDRNFVKMAPKVQTIDNVVEIDTPDYSVAVLANAKSLKDVRVVDRYGQSLYQSDGSLPPSSYLPAPGSIGRSWLMADSPRLVPPAWGATPAPKNVDPALASKSGWDDRNDAPDVYVFVPGAGGYAQLKKDFLKLTGPIPKPPLYIMGFIDSRYHPYTEKEALDSIDTYRAKHIPLDTFVVDTDWRINGSAGYDVEKNDFPDMPRFIKEAHDRHVKLMFNDHPDPKAAGATDPVELAFRWDGLTKLLGWGIDLWWYDRNWMTSLHEPMPGLRKEVWGQRLYHDIEARFRPNVRPWIMSNAQGIDNGIEHYPPDPAGHRYPMMWTGDTRSQFSFLKRGVQNGVDRGLLALQPYTHEDLGGHTGPTPSPELYVRYLEYGALSPITRVHCTRGQDRHPWTFGAEAEKIVTDYIKLRYRLLPTIYTAAQHATDDGTPILRRCDLYWPSSPEAAHDDQYMLGDDILVAPITAQMPDGTNPIAKRSVWIPPGLWEDLWTGDTISGPKTITASAGLSQIPMWVARGGIVLTGPDMQYTGEKPMDPITADVYLGEDGKTSRELVEDDGISNDYLRGALARTSVQYVQAGSVAAIKIGGAKGSYAGMRSNRSWVVRLHLPPAAAPVKVTLDGKETKTVTLPRGVVHMPFEAVEGPAEGDVVTVEIPTSSIRKGHEVLVSLTRR